ncbi:PqqD family protein [Cereibacter changlensis JA139]|uniref:PqqD family protein n=2 Tax=Cereibacter changlensis TaxID=402884 RepID=A0A2T4JT76_9RHOB|nr:PqqD family protein [Cereibacter changlensis]PTE21109.1 PqqD family protein [Cereibacter changlensis JA139]PZX52894.1 coenzyme PQQ synthesis protein D (PqqD) [Cereibacter changlensis]
MKDFRIDAISIAPGCVECAFGDGIAIFDTETNAYFSMNAVGQYVWSLLAEPASIDSLVEQVAARYGIPVERSRADVQQLIDELARHRLVVVQ